MYIKFPTYVTFIDGSLHRGIGRRWRYGGIFKASLHNYSVIPWITGIFLLRIPPVLVGSH
jgi:hypothetical protein